MPKLPPDEARCHECQQIFSVVALRWQPKPRYCSLRCSERAQVRAVTGGDLPPGFPALPVEKRCAGCGEFKSLDAFDRRSAVQPEYSRGWCRACSRQNGRTH